MRTRIPKGKLLFAHVEQTKEDAQKAVDAYREDRRNKGTWTINRFPRTVRADGVAITCTVVIVRERL